MPARTGGAVSVAWLLCAAALAAAAPAAAGAGPDSAASMYSPQGVVAIELTLPPSSLKTLEKEPNGDEYVEGTFSAARTDGTPTGVEEFTAPQKVEVRLKGSAGSFRKIGAKAAFKLKFPKTGLFLGLRRMTLNNMVQDPSMLRETLAYDLFRALGVPASRTGYAFLRVNGEPYGVYLNIETLDSVALPQWFDSTLHLYEADSPGTDLTAAGAPAFEVDEGDEGDVSDLEALIAVANDSAGDWSEGMAAVADLEQMTRMWAVERYTGHWDGYAGPEGGLLRPNNYYLHSDGAGVFRMVPWGTDQTWDLAVDFGQTASGLLVNKCLADASCAELYEAALTDVAATVPGLDLDGKATCATALLDPWQRLEGPKRREHDPRQIAAGVAETRAFIARRPVELAEWLGAEAPVVPAGTDSCSGPAPLPTPAAQPAATPRLRYTRLPPSPPRFRAGTLSLEGRWLKLRVGVPLPGRLRLTAEMEAQGGATVCAGRRDVAAAGPSLLACRLSRLAHRALGTGPLKLEVKIALAAAAGTTHVATRTVVLTRR